MSYSAYLDEVGMGVGGARDVLVSEREMDAEEETAEFVEDFWVFEA